MMEQFIYSYHQHGKFNGTEFVHRAIKMLGNYRFQRGMLNQHPLKQLAEKCLVVTTGIFFAAYLLFNLIHRREEILIHAKGSTYPEINKSVFRGMSLLKPAEQVLVGDRRSGADRCVRYPAAEQMPDPAADEVIDVVDTAAAVVRSKETAVITHVPSCTPWPPSSPAVEQPTIAAFGNRLRISSWTSQVSK